MADAYALALQKALFTKLTASDADLAGLIGSRVYDEPPQAAQRPYVRFGTFTLRPLRTDGKAAGRVTFSIEAHSRPNSGRVEATRIAEEIVSSLDEAAVTVVGYDLVHLQYITQDVEQDADGKSYTAVVAFEALLDG